MIKLALLGAGAIAQTVAASLSASDHVRITAVSASTPESAGVRAVRSALPYAVEFVPAPQIATADAEWVFEAAGASAARDYVPSILAAGKNVIAMSSGVFLDPEVLERCRPYLQGNQRLIFPSGAIAGLDAVAALARAGSVSEISLTSTKSPRSLRGAPFFAQEELPDDFAGVVFEGDASTAARQFPANANVAATLAFAGLGPTRTRVVIRSDPSATRTRHQVVCRGSSATLDLTISSEPSPLNPRSSLMAALSAADTVTRLLRGSSGFIEPLGA